MRTLAIVNQKGGCGKTTTAINLAAISALRGIKTLLVDLDPQSHCALGFAVPESRIELHVGDALLIDYPNLPRIDDMTWQISANLDLLPSSMQLAKLESPSSPLNRLPDRDRRLERFLASVCDSYDFVFIDCPPSIGLLTFNAIRAASEIIIPVETSYFALHGAEKQVRTIQTIIPRIGRDIRYMLLPTLYDQKLRLSREILAELRKRFTKELVPTVINYCNRLREAASFGQSIVEYDPLSQGRQDYERLFDWLLKKENRIDALISRSYELEYTTRNNGTKSANNKNDSNMPLVKTRSITLDDKGNNTSESSEMVSESFIRNPLSQYCEQKPSGSGSSSLTSNRAAELVLRARKLLQKQDRVRRQNEYEAANRSQSGLSTGKTTQSEGIIQVEEKEEESCGKQFGVVSCAAGITFIYPALSPDQQINLAGDFNNWSPSSLPLRFNKKNTTFETFIQLPPGRYSYRYVLDGRWVTDQYNPLSEPNEYGELNSIVEVIGSQ